MAARGHIPSAFEGRNVQAPGMMRHGPFPGLGRAVHRPLEHIPPPDLLENKMVVHATEMERLARENQRLAITHVALRQDLVAAQQEMQRLQAHVGSIQTESDIQIRGLLDKIVKMEANLRAGESVKLDLQQAHAEAKSLVTARQDLTVQIQQTTQEFQKVHGDLEKLPELCSELDGLRQEHQRLRAAFEYEKGLNMQQVEQMQAMENNLVSMAREVEKLRAEVSTAEKRAHAPNPYVYSSPDPPYPAVGQGISYVDGYGRPQVQMNGGPGGEVMNTYGGGVGFAGSGVAGGAGGVAWGGSYDAVRGARPLPRR
ncbi:protein FLX-like 4 [Tasmannia lanceolata]|uniref:protein FLX-like 4 n=1 Tax=Tasmannia lanceolata TaxID=3420 RepID=UPI004063A07D